MASVDTPPKNQAKSQGEIFNRLVLQVQSLGRRSPLSGDDAKYAGKILLQLYQMGFTNHEIEELSAGTWKESNIKKYTRGADHGDSTFRDEALIYLLKMAGMGLTLEGVKEDVSMRIGLLGNNVSVNDLAGLVRECNDAGISPQALVEMQKKLAQIQDVDPLSLGGLKELLAYRSELDGMGIDLLTLKKVIGAAKKYGRAGEYSDLLDGMSKFKDLSALSDSLAEMNAKREELQMMVDKTLPDRIAQLQGEVEKLEQPLRIFNEVLKPRGYDERVLSILSESAEKYQTQGGIKTVIEAVTSHVQLSEIKEELSQLQFEKDRVATELMSIRNETSHLATVNKMCELLIFQFGFSIDSIHDLVTMAQSYGRSSVIDVLNAVAKYGEIVKLQQHLDALAAEKTDLEVKIGSLEKQLVKLNAEVEQVSALVASAIEPMKQAYQNGAEQLALVYETELKALQQESVKQSEKLAAEKMFAEELSLARLIASMQRYPSELTEVPVGTAVAILDAVIRFCSFRGLDPKTTVGRFLGASGHFNLDTPLPASYLLHQARDLIGSGLR